MIVKKNEMNNIKSIPAGYKQTEAGIIPEDWDVFILGDVFDFKNGLNKGKEYFGVGTPIINYMDVYISGGIYSSFVQGKVLVTQEEKKNYSARKGDVFFTRTSETVEEIGLSSVLLDEIKDAVFSGFILRGRQKTDVFVYSFMKYCFRAENLRRQIKNTASYTTRALTNGSMLSKVIAPAPNKKEQSAIGKVLSDTDTLITALEQLITKKKAIKTATMQQLTTGRTRLPQFAKHSNGTLKSYKSSELGLIPEDWDVYTFDDLIESCSSGATPYRGNKNFYKGRNKWITSGELNYCVINDTLEKISDEAVKRSNLKIHPAGTFLMAITGLEAAGTRGACGIVGQPAATNQSCMAIYPNEKLISAYLYHWYVYNGEALAFKYCQGTKQLSYTAGLLRTIPLYIPNMVEEQTAIATILSDMDAELIALERKLAKFRDIKQGMMQQLLTGRIRLPLEQQP